MLMSSSKDSQLHPMRDTMIVHDSKDSQLHPVIDTMLVPVSKDLQLHPVFSMWESHHLSWGDLILRNQSCYSDVSSTNDALLDVRIREREPEMNRKKTSSLCQFNCSRLSPLK